MRSLIKDKRGYSLGGWSEGILLSILAVMILGIIIGGMNLKYSQNNQLGLGGNTTESAFVDYQSTLEREISGGEAVFDAQSGLTLKSSWGIIKSGITIIWDFFTGGWIETIVAYMKLPTQVALIFRLLYFLSIGYIILKILFKVKA